MTVTIACQTGSDRVSHKIHVACAMQIPGGYGKIRMWGAIGWGGVSPIGISHYHMLNSKLLLHKLVY